ncbi:MAG: 4-hydroxy-tetrahydrodipicolinate synthase [Planctomycetota bacterium]|nr:4-hydroxy-tetrahydrodipicolinate synthase [Planctomycetota bacterium]
MSDDGLRIEGTGTAIVTPFRDGAVDLEGLGSLIEAQIAGGIDFLVPCGTTGESPTLTDPERIAVIERTVDVVNGRVPVVAGTGTNDTPHSIAMTKAARAAGANACLAVSPYYNKPSQEGLYRHFRAMIDEGGLPAVLYHIPSRCGIGIEVHTIARVCAAGGVVGLKETETIGRITELRAACDVPILSGDDGLTFPMICLGGVGVISVTSNVAPAQVSAMVRHARAGELEAARTLHEALSPLFRALFVESNPGPVKAAAKMLGLIASDEVRLPLTRAEDATRAILEDALTVVTTAV